MQYVQLKLKKYNGDIVKIQKLLFKNNSLLEEESVKALITNYIEDRISKAQKKEDKQVLLMFILDQLKLNQEEKEKIAIKNLKSLKSMNKYQLKQISEKIS